MKKFLFRGVSAPLAIIIIAIFASVVLGLVSVLKTINYQENISDFTFSVNRNETKDWKTYRDEEYGFEVKYPENVLSLRVLSSRDLELESPFDYPVEFNPDIRVFRFGTKEQSNDLLPESIDIAVNPINKQDIEFFDEEKKYLSCKSFVLGEKAHRCDVNDEWSRGSFIRVFNQGKHYVLSDYTSKRNSNNDRDRQTKIFEKMVFTFKFIK